MEATPWSFAFQLEAPNSWDVQEGKTAPVSPTPAAMKTRQSHLSSLLSFFFFMSSTGVKLRRRWTVPSEAAEAGGQKVKMVATVVKVFQNWGLFVFLIALFLQEKTIFWVKLTSDEVSIEGNGINGHGKSPGGKASSINIAATTTVLALFASIILGPKMTT